MRIRISRPFSDVVGSSLLQTWRDRSCAKPTSRPFRVKDLGPVITFGCHTRRRKRNWIVDWNACGSSSRRCNGLSYREARKNRIGLRPFPGERSFLRKAYGTTLSIVDGAPIRSPALGHARLVAYLPESQVRTENRRVMAHGG